MSTIPALKVTLERKDENYLFEAKGKTGTPVLIDNISQENAKGASPMELLLMGVGGCSAIDIIYILKKQRQEVTGYTMQVEGQREELKEAKPFSAVHITIHLDGDIDPAKAKRAAELSFEKYCSVSITMEASVKITYSVLVNGKDVNS
jgi:putative redox protein